jgi:hypothetical protein
VVACGSGEGAGAVGCRRAGRRHRGSTTPGAGVGGHARPGRGRKKEKEGRERKKRKGRKERKEKGRKKMKGRRKRKEGKKMGIEKENKKV